MTGAMITVGPTDPDVAAAAPPRAPTTAVVFGRRYRIPGTPLRRRVLGWSFIAGGLFSFLPVLGPWMFPVGFVILSVDSARMRRSRRRLTITVGRRWPRLNAAMQPKRQ
jgi:hypothetical protein